MWGPINFADEYYRTYAFVNACQNYVPESVRVSWVQGRTASSEDKHDKITYFETLFPPEDDIDELIRKDVELIEEDGKILISLGAELCTQIPTMAYFSHFKRWQALALKIRELYRKDPSRIHHPFDWGMLTAWYIRAVDISLQIAGPPRDQPSSSEEGET